MNNGLVQEEAGIDQKMILKITTGSMMALGSLDKSRKKEEVLLIEKYVWIGVLICYYMNSNVHVNLGAITKWLLLHQCSHLSFIFIHDSNIVAVITPVRFCHIRQQIKKGYQPDSRPFT